MKIAFHPGNKLPGIPGVVPKIYPDDIPVLKKIGQNKRMIGIARRLWVNKHAGSDIIVATDNPMPAGYRETVLIKEGLKLGGSEGLSLSGSSIYKGSNIFPENIIGNELGKWDINDKKVLSLNIYRYKNYLGNNVFAVRKMSQIPTAAKCGEDIVFNNSVHIISLENTFPLNIYLLSRIVQYFAFKTLRTEVMLRRRSVWNVAEIHNIPVPEIIDIHSIEAIGSRIFHYSNDILNKYRHVEQIVNDSQMFTLRESIIDNKIDSNSINLSTFQNNIKVRSDEFVCRDNRITNGIFIDIPVRDNLLFKYLKYHISEILSDEEYIDKSMFLNVRIPIDNLTQVVEAIDAANTDNPEEKYKQEVESLDLNVGKALGLADEDIQYIIRQFTEDPFLKRISPNMPHLGMKFQAYRSDYQKSAVMPLD